MVFLFILLISLFLLTFPIYFTLKVHFSIKTERLIFIIGFFNIYNFKISIFLKKNEFYYQINEGIERQYQIIPKKIILMLILGLCNVKTNGYLSINELDAKDNAIIVAVLEIIKNFGQNIEIIKNKNTTLNIQSKGLIFPIKGVLNGV